MSGAHDDLVERLAAIEEELRDRAYAALRAVGDGASGAAGEEKRLLRARRAVERAIGALAAGDDPDDEARHGTGREPDG